MQYSLEVRDLCKVYPGFALDHVSFAIPKGSIMGFVGANGAGKSTTIGGILRLIRTDGGQVRFWGEELTDGLKEDIGVVFDGIHFYEKLTVAQTGRICAGAYKRWDGERFASYLNKFQLPPDKQVKELSRGMKMKLSIALALSHQPRLLILDEATGGLDPVVRDDILDVFLEFVEDEDHAILMSSHITSDLEKVADYITFIHEGKVIFSVPKDVVRYEYGIIRCREEDLQKLDDDQVLAKRHETMQWSVLVRDKAAARRSYPELVVDDATIDECMLIHVKGEKCS